MESTDAFIDRLPKAELHLHLVGSASVPTVLELRRRHPDGAGVPSSAAELAAFYEFRDFPHFSKVYGAVSSLVREPSDVAELVRGAATGSRWPTSSTSPASTARPPRRPPWSTRSPARPRRWWASGWPGSSRPGPVPPACSARCSPRRSRP